MQYTLRKTFNGCAGITKQYATCTMAIEQGINSVLFGLIYLLIGNQIFYLRTLGVADKVLQSHGQIVAAHDFFHQMIYRLILLLLGNKGIKFKIAIRIQ